MVHVNYDGMVAKCFAVIPTYQFEAFKAVTGEATIEVCTALAASMKIPVLALVDILTGSIGSYLESWLTHVAVTGSFVLTIWAVRGTVVMLAGGNARTIIAGELGIRAARHICIGKIKTTCYRW